MTCCTASVRRGSGWHTYREPCKRRGVVTRDGKPYCKQHDPVERKARQERRYAEFKKKGDRRQLEHDACTDVELLTDEQLRRIVELGGIGAMLQRIDG